MSKPRATDPTVACFGETIWDYLPRGRVLGGAALNVAYHLQRLGLAPVAITAVGRDFLGDEARRRMAAWGLDLSFVARRARATGTARARLDATGGARYTFGPRPAWDLIPAPRALHRLPPPTAVVFGTLALRRVENRRTLAGLLASWSTTTRVLDINLRPPFDRAEPIKWALARATVLKLNTDELARLSGLGEETPAGWARAVRRLGRRHRIRRICLTAGSRGAGLLWDGRWSWADAIPIKVRDTVGAGDGFLAALLAGLLLRRELPQAALGRACRLGEFIASRSGATPPYHYDTRGRLRD